MKRLVRNMVLLIVFVLVTGIAFDSWLGKKATLIIQKEEALQRIAVDLALLMETESRLERAVAVIAAGGHTQDFPKALAFVIQMKALGHVQLVRLKIDTSSGFHSIHFLDKLLQERQTAHAAALQIVQSVRQGQQEQAHQTWNQTVRPAFSRFMAQARSLFSEISPILEKDSAILASIHRERKWEQWTTYLVWVAVLTWASMRLFGMAGRIAKAASVVRLASERNLASLSGVTGKDEAGEIGQGIDQLIGELSKVITQLDQNAQDVSEESGHLEIVLKKVIESFVESREMLKGVRKDASSLAAAALSESDIASQLGKDVGQALNQAQSGSQIVHSVLESVKSIAGEIQELAQRIHSLKGASDKIGSIAETITEIADQTNLLSLNAAIEAARAGEQGRGFAVVAEEVRKLAQTTSQATAEIRKAIEDIQSLVTETVEEINKEAVTLSETGTGANQAEEIIDRIVSVVKNTEEGMKTIIEAANNQKKASSQILDSVEGLAHTMEDRLEDVQAANPAVHQLKEVTRALTTITGSFSLKRSL
ncbi:methyl-accepting chemotaxis protein [Leptospirillum ferriphilum]|uniref:methyl-accepting chemotaxis protein n=1 Tax=Leptospirillum ferriphilum TaxID=178606 RepID=UPI0009876322|nr:methyl-accepting chemotaxis protein [Leptospirillum ferriphilum]OOH82081.1 hypothetical protein BOX30_04310 [Leptospirillum ferriphilum]